MVAKISKSVISGEILIPGSKSHTIRALFFAMLAEGKSSIKNYLSSLDTNSAEKLCKKMGCRISKYDGELIIEGTAGRPLASDDVIDIGNSGTSMLFGIAASSLIDGSTVLTGDKQIRNRPVGPLIESLKQLGAKAFCTRSNGCPPVVVSGKAKGGETSIEAVTSQYLSALLIVAPLFENDTKIYVPILNEAPYIDMTLKWLDRFGIEYVNNDYKEFLIKGGQKYSSFDASIPGDFSSATFFAVLAAISGGSIKIDNLDFNDTQGDKKVFNILEQMGAEIIISKNSITVIGRELNGMDIDMNSIPDALPAMAVAACFAQGETRLLNVPQARLKETDRIKVMCTELSKMGADISEIEDGLVIKKSKLTGCNVNGMGDHRIVMALTAAGLNSSGDTYIDTAESAEITFPEFYELIIKCGGKVVKH